MTHALLVTSSFLPGHGGIESYLAELCDRLAPSLAVLAPGRRDGTDLPAGLGYTAIPGPGRMQWPGRRVAEAIVDATTTTGARRVLYGTPWPLALTGPAIKRRGIPYAVVVHGAELLVPASIPGLSRRLAGALAAADLLLPVSRFTAGRIAHLLERHGLTVPPVALLRAAVDTERFSPDAGADEARRELGIPSDARIVLCFGRLVARKGVDRALDAVHRLAKERAGLLLVIAGTGPKEKSLRRRARRSGAPARFLGRIPGRLAPGLYAAAELFVLPVADRWWGLDTEGLGVVLLEAAACGTPCVTGISGGTPEAVVDGITGHVVDAHDHHALSRAMASILDDRERARAMGAAGLRHVRDEFGGGLPDEFLKWLERGV